MIRQIVNYLYDFVIKKYHGHVYKRDRLDWDRDVATTSRLDWERRHGRGIIRHGPTTLELMLESPASYADQMSLRRALKRQTR